MENEKTKELERSGKCSRKRFRVLSNGGWKVAFLIAVRKDMLERSWRGQSRKSLFRRKISEAMKEGSR
jgi:hypothetical protein